MSTPNPTLRLTGWATIAQAAAALGVHRDTVSNMIARGDIYAERVGPRLVRVDLDSVRRVPLGPAAELRTIKRPAAVDDRIAAGVDE